MRGHDVEEDVSQGGNHNYFGGLLAGGDVLNPNHSYTLSLSLTSPAIISRDRFLEMRYEFTNNDTP